MTNVIKNNIPNTVTCLNLFSGCIACVMAFEAKYELALLFIVLSSIFDFFDGLLARALNAHSIIGKDLDSLADDVSFGVAPSLIVFSLFKEMYYPATMEFIAPYLPYAAFLISVFSALRLAKFNNDTRQTSSFVGLPVPANALFWGSLVAGAHDLLSSCLPFYISMSVFVAVGIRDTDVFPEIQESLMEGQQNKFYIPDYLHSLPCISGNCQLCSHHCMVYFTFTFYKKNEINNLLARLLYYEFYQSYN